MIVQIMTLREFLEYGQGLHARIAGKLDRLGELRTKIFNISGSGFDLAGRYGSDNHHRQQDLICSYDELGEEIQRDREALADYRHRLAGLIDELEDPNEIDLLFRRYALFEKWEDISKEMGICSRHVSRIRTRAEKNLNDIYIKRALSESLKSK